MSDENNIPKLVMCEELFQQIVSIIVQLNSNRILNYMFLEILKNSNENSYSGVSF